MNTQFGYIKDEIAKKHLDKMIGKVFKILHLKEEGCSTIEKYRDSVCRKIVGSYDIYFDENLMMIVTILRGLNFEDETLRSDIFEAIRIIESIKEKV